MEIQKNLKYIFFVNYKFWNFRKIYISKFWKFFFVIKKNPEFFFFCYKFFEFLLKKIGTNAMCTF